MKGVKMHPLDLSYFQQKPVSHSDGQEVYFSQISFCLTFTLSFLFSSTL